MAYLSRRFTWTNHSETGIDGWLPDATKHDELFLPSGGVGVAHDTMEHFVMDGSMLDECHAFGAMWFIRAQPNRLRDYERVYYTRAHSFANDLATMYRDNQYADLPEGKLPRPVDCLFDLYAEREEMRTEFLKLAEGEDSDRYVESEYNTASDILASREQDHEWFDRAFAHIARGVLKAKKRWGSSVGGSGSGYEACDLFFQLVKDVDKIRGEEGDTLAVHINIKRLSYNVVVNGHNIDEGY